MKPKNNLIVAAGFLISFIAGMLIGLILTNPGRNVIEVVGTIGKVDKYRNVKVTEQDIELRNNLLEDESLKEAYKNYLLYEYAANVKMGDDIQFAIEAAGKIEEFRTANIQSLDRLEDYAYFLDNARLQILEAIATLNELDNRSQIAIRTVMNNAGNAMAQTTYRSNVLFEFITAVERFFDSAHSEENPGLARAHDLLLANLFTASIINEDTPALNYLSGRQLYTNDENLALKAEALQTCILVDTEKLHTGFTDQESLQNFVLRSEHMHMGVFYDSETLGVALQFGTRLMAEQLGTRLMESEQLGRLMESEQLGSSVIPEELYGLLVMINDAPMLQDVLQSREDMLGSFPW
jgi:hypothetical protein